MGACVDVYVGVGVGVYMDDEWVKEVGHSIMFLVCVRMCVEWLGVDDKWMLKRSDMSSRLLVFVLSTLWLWSIE